MVRIDGDSSGRIVVVVVTAPMVGLTWGGPKSGTVERERERDG